MQTLSRTRPRLASRCFCPTVGQVGIPLEEESHSFFFYLAHQPGEHLYCTSSWRVTTNALLLMVHTFIPVGFQLDRGSVEHA